VTRVRPLTAGGLLLLAACAPKLTPQQEWVMTKFEECRHGWNARLDRVEPDGRFYVTVAQTQTDYNRVIACMQDKQAREREGPPR
jgi:hypothetical protein